MEATIRIPLSYWELDQYFKNIDYAVIGAGIVGLSCAMALKEKHPDARVLVLERGLLPQGASTKNAGFACFGSISELLDDMNFHTEEEMVDLVRQRYLGIQLLRKTLGDKSIGYKPHKGYELFLKGDPDFFEACLENRKRLNKLLKPVFKKKVFKVRENGFGFAGIQDHYLVNTFEGQLNTGKMMNSLYKKCIKKGVKVLFGVELEDYVQLNGKVILKTPQIEFSADNLLVATNGFAGRLLNEDVRPARAQVLITSPIKNLKVKGTFHLDKGYYYFRNIHNRILLGGGRNLDFEGENTADFGETATIQNRLDQLLREVILPGQEYEVEHRWSGIMGLGINKEPIVKPLTNNVFCGVKLGGMGVAIGSHTGHALAKLAVS
ncbi:NAD(P)/FAD-dependent oxidoreductase [Robertkochia aurantiaca]|uniref:NAD(P)/FAD-dependent oxidoreductase n=1 Tax=Robertkochia aurantiaca TaxID=2873700 RepID=UPI002103A969|nr:FAD-dependent oxidoreductase [Robertkochia sp. 3YJGBD-33]